MGLQDRLIALRKERKISQKKLAQALNVSETAVQNYEYGRVPTLEIAVALAEYFGVSVEYLVGKEKAPQAMGLTERETDLIKYFRALGNDGQLAVLRAAKNEYLIQGSSTQHSRIVESLKRQDYAEDKKVSQK